MSVGHSACEYECSRTEEHQYYRYDHIENISLPDSHRESDVAPIRQQFYRVPLVKQKILEDEVQVLPENGLAKLFHSGFTPQFIEGKCPFYMD